jgi:Tfp pilus assembly protein FimT
MKNNKGFTIFELVILLLIVAVLSVSTGITIDFIKGFKLTSAAEKLTADIRYAQSQAMSKTLWEGVSFEADPINKYTVYQTNGTINTNEVDPADFSKTLLVDVKQKFDVKIISYSFEGGGNRVLFNGLGKPYIAYGGALFTQEAEATIVLGIDTLTKTITITRNTGKVAIQ